MNTIVRVYGSGEWRTMTAAEIAGGLQTGAAINALSLVGFFTGVVSAGGDAQKLGELWDVAGGRFVDRAETTLAEGDLTGMQGLLATIPASVRTAIGATTLAAIQTVISNNTLSAGAANWNSADGDMPAEFTEAWVTSTLEAAGYTWNGAQWVQEG